MTHLYVHIPFCRSRCAYCDFYSEPIDLFHQTDAVVRYVEALGAELSERASGCSFETIYVGGGTPTVLPRHLLQRLITFLRERAAEDCEFTVEANPGTIDKELLVWLKAAGVTRLSVGIQSFDPQLRAVLGRRVTQREVREALQVISEVGWENWNIDLIFGIPGETWEQAAEDLDIAVAAQPTHISLYDLTYTPSYEKRICATLGPDAIGAAANFAEKYYQLAVERLEMAGFMRYEISNYARPGYECKHNLAYWRGEDYIGIGAAAVSTLGAMRINNSASVWEYLQGRGVRAESLSWRTRLWERAMLGLRTCQGIDENEVTEVLDQDAKNRLLELGCIERCCGKLRISRDFFNVANTVITALLVQP
ncbi:MAG: radical SAM family heme chaperone HemW [Thermoleophilia bacterium]|nr:radical SAM family heme chaperone HemW [Thermoleophilia bacterium]